MKSSMYVVASLILISSGCNGTETTSNANPSVSLPPSVDVRQASAQDCPNGGIAVVSYQDTNLNGVFDSGDVLIKKNNVCNGANGQTGATGAQGYGAGVTTAAASTSACPSGGTVITTYVDQNNDAQLESGEAITSVSTLCNGIAGARGAAGQSANLTSTAATAQQCPNGGVVYSASAGNAAPTQTVVCNGQDGTNASFESGPLGDAIAGKPYTACHHDYLYISGSGTARGWLIFRHQKNGSADQGIGSTGFQIWDVDIADFELGSEVGNVVYCTLHWDPSTKRLSYTVNVNTDNLAGRTGAIQL